MQSKSLWTLAAMIIGFAGPSRFTYASCAGEPGQGLWVNESEHVDGYVPQRLEIIGAHCGGPLRPICDAYSCLPPSPRTEGPIMRVWARCPETPIGLCDWGQVDLNFSTGPGSWITAPRTGSQWVNTGGFSYGEVHYRLQYAGRAADVMFVDFSEPGRPDRTVTYTFRRTALSQEWNINRPGLDYKDFEMPDSAREIDCRQQCATESLCLSFAFGRDQKGRQHCWLKNGIPPAVVSEGWVSGTVSLSGPRRMTYEWGIDRGGSDIAMLDLASNDYGECALKCLGNSRCDAYTFVPAGMQGDAAKCWLKSGIPMARPGLNLVSGVKKR